MSEKYEQRQTITFEHEGDKLFGVLHTPMGEGPFPAVLIVHGFAGNRIGHRRLYVMQSEALARAGIASLRVDHRGCGDSEGRFGDVTIERLVSDMTRALAFLAEQHAIDAERVGMLGVSLGGPISVRTARAFERLRSLALWAPVADGVHWQEDFAKAYPNASVGSHIRCGGDAASAEFQAQFLDIHVHEELPHLGEVPLFHAHGGADGVVFPNHAALYRQARDGASADSQFVLYPNSDHHFGTHTEERQDLVDETVAWFKRTLTS